MVDKQFEEIQKLGVTRGNIKRHIDSAIPVAYAIDSFRENVKLNLAASGENIWEMTNINGLVDAGVLTFDEVYDATLARIEQGFDDIDEEYRVYDFFFDFLSFFHDSDLKTENNIRIVIEKLSQIDFRKLSVYGIAKLLTRLSFYDYYSSLIKANFNESYIQDFYHYVRENLDNIATSAESSPFNFLSSRVLYTFMGIGFSEFCANEMISNISIFDEIGIYNVLISPRYSAFVSDYLQNLINTLLAGNDLQSLGQLDGYFAEFVEFAGEETDNNMLQSVIEYILGIIEVNINVILLLKKTLKRLCKRDKQFNDYCLEKLEELEKEVASNDDIVKFITFCKKTKTTVTVQTLEAKTKTDEVKQTITFENVENALSYLYSFDQVTLDNYRQVVPAVVYLVENNAAEQANKYIERLDYSSADILINDMHILRMIDSKGEIQYFDNLVRLHFLDLVEQVDQFINKKREEVIQEIDRQLGLSGLNLSLESGQIRLAIDEQLRVLTLPEIKFLKILLKKHGVLSKAFTDFITGNLTYIDLHKNGTEIFVSRNGKVVHKGMTYDSVNIWLDLLKKGIKVEPIYGITKDEKYGTYTVESGYVGITLDELFGMLGINNVGPQDSTEVKEIMAEALASMGQVIQGINISNFKGLDYLSGIEKVNIVYGYRYPFLNEITGGAIERNMQIEALGYEHGHFHVNNVGLLWFLKNYLRNPIYKTTIDYNGVPYDLPANINTILPITGKVTDDFRIAWENQDWQTLVSVFDFDMVKAV